jgi:hypothetical protein
MSSLRRHYEDEVRELRSRVEAWRHEDLPIEQIARRVCAERRALAVLFKQRTPEPMRSAIMQRTVETYGDPLGPTVEFLRARGKSWEEIIEGAMRPGSFGFANGKPAPQVVKRCPHKK